MKEKPFKISLIRLSNGRAIYNAVPNRDVKQIPGFLSLDTEVNGVKVVRYIKECDVEEIIIAKEVLMASFPSTDRQEVNE